MKNDSIFPITRFTAIILLPFLWLAFLILYFFPDSTGQRFAWLVQPHMTSMYMGAGYMGSSWLFVSTGFRKRWHRVHGGFLPITVFAWFMLISTFLHWDRFSYGTLSFTLWLLLYIITPFLIPFLWLYNRQTDTNQPEESDVIIDPLVLWVVRIFGFLMLVAVVEGFFFPEFLIRIWPWPLTPLTARVMCGWIALLGVGALTMTADPRWSAWRVPLESIFIWHVFVFVAIAASASDFSMSLLNWYTLTILGMMAAIAIFYPTMERRRKELNL